MDEENAKDRQEFNRGALRQACWTSREKAAAQPFIGAFKFLTYTCLKIRHLRLKNCNWIIMDDEYLKNVITRDP
jgi:hypothetical protein